MNIYDIIQTSINDELENFLNAVNEKYSLDIKPDFFRNVTIVKTPAVKTPRNKKLKKRTAYLNFIKTKTEEFKCIELDNKRVVYKNFIIDKNSNCVIGKLDKDNKECFLTKDDCEECKDMGLKYVF